MSTVEVLEIGRDAIFVLLKVGAPIMLIALMVGLTISLAQPGDAGRRGAARDTGLV